MGNSCNEKNPLIHSGTSQGERLLKALQPAYAPVDDRTDADLLLFIKNYARYIQFYDSSNIADGNWEALMQSDVAVVLATLSLQNHADNIGYLRRLNSLISEASDNNSMKQKFGWLFDFSFSILYHIQEEYKHLPTDISYERTLRLGIQSQLGKLYQQLKAYYTKCSVTYPLIDTTDNSTDPDAPIAIVKSATCIASLDADSLWSFPLSNYEPYVHGDSVSSRIRNTISHNLFSGINDGILKQNAKISSDATTALEGIFENYPKHRPHYALVLTFAKLFAYARARLNDFTENHLNFYYKDILQIENRAADSDSMHLIFELTKLSESYMLPAGTVFKGGKDSNGAELFYSNSEEVFLNKGSIASVKNLLRTSSAESTTGLYAGAIANSSDGNGAAISNTDNSWYTFGSESYSPAAYGMALSSHMFYCKGGSRKFTISFTLTDSSLISTSDVAGKFSVQLSGKSGWIAATNSQVTAAVNSSTSVFSLTFTIAADAEAIVPYDQKIHQQQFDTSDPVCMIFPDNDSGASNLYNKLSKLTISKIAITCDVTDLKEFSIQNDISTLDASKPFEIFGNKPVIGSSFIIGSKEIFSKNQQQSITPKISIEWNDFTKLNDAVDSQTHTVNYSTLQSGKFSSSESEFLFDFGSGHIKRQKKKSGHIPEYEMHILQSGSSLTSANIPANSGVVPDYNSDAPYSISETYGFLKLELSADEFGHSIYVQQLMDYAKNESYHKAYTSGGSGSGSAVSGVPPEPYTPSVKSISIGYNATYETETDGSATGIVLYHVLPHLNSPLDYGDSTVAAFAQPLIPVVEAEGELWIGIENASPSNSISILFKFSEGSADPFAERQSLSWFYLDEDNRWQLFDTHKINDGTKDFTQTGIVTISLPAELSNSNLASVSDLYWIKACTESSKSVCNIIDIKAQAALVTLTDYQNAGTAYTEARAANTVSKAISSISSVKKITQPYESFGGRSIESDSDYYTRVSERLRHKNRAVSIWDYEHLVLESFPELYKVKCLNHHYPAASGDREMKPGHVTLVPVADLKGKSVINPLRPYTSIGTLTEIDLYLKDRISPFVNLHVTNPLFEEIQLDFKVVFSSDDAAYYHDILMSDIEQFLTPWAFDSSADMEFGGVVRKSVLINFIEERSYVDHITCVKMYHYVNGYKEGGDQEEIVATTPRSVLVSFEGTETNPKHIIDYENEGCNC